MMKKLLLSLSLLTALPAFAADGLIAVKSPRNATDTLARAEQLVQARGLTVFARIDHSAGAAKVNQSLRPTQLLIFGNPQGGTPLMLCAQSMGIDLPLKLLAWEDEKGQAWLGYNDPVWLMKRHGAPDCPAAANVAKALASIAEATTAP